MRHRPVFFAALFLLGAAGRARAQGINPTEPECAKQAGKEGCDRYYPDPSLTPGHFDANVFQADAVDTVCKDHYTQTVRDVTEDEKQQVFARYGVKPTDNPFGYEIDHFVSLELGGTNDLDNLWPQPYCQPGTGGKTCIGAREKDVVETKLKDEVCAGKMTLDQARSIITTDWYKFYVSLKGIPAP